jgi:hypothetical protein
MGLTNATGCGPIVFNSPTRVTLFGYRLAPLPPLLPSFVPVPVLDWVRQRQKKRRALDRKPLS